MLRQRKKSGLFCGVLKNYAGLLSGDVRLLVQSPIIKTGWIERQSLELLLDKVEGVLVDQTITGRIFNFGAINIIGTGGTNDRFPFIPDPLLFRKTVQQQVENFEEMMRKPAPPESTH